MRRVFIVNPIAGNGKALRIGKTLEIVCKVENLDYEIIYTTGPGHAKDIAKQKSEKYDDAIIYSVGGDGTLNEVVNGIINSNVILGVIPGGSGNDFYKMIEEKKELFKKIDVGKVNGRYFINIASLGLDAKIAKRANEIKSKYISRPLIYYFSIISELIKLESINLKTDEESKRKNLTMLSVCNGSYYGGGIKIAPSASLTSGLFEVYEVSKMKRLQTLKLLMLLLKGQHENSEYVNHWKTNSLVVESNVPLICNVDGEIIKDQKFVFEKIEDGLNLLYQDHPKIMELHKKGFK